jgi:porphobilinogen synthase
MKQATQQPPANKSTAVALSPEDLAMVLLVRDTPGSSRPVPTLTVPELRQQATLLAGLGIRAVKVFASSTRRHPERAPWKTPADLMTQAITEIKAAAPAMTVMTETCLCSYTPAGECYLPGPGGKADVPATIAALADQAVAQADAGADIVGPAAMIPGTVRAARAALDETGHAVTGIMPHLILDSRLYDVYRAAMGAMPASGDVRAFQGNPSRPREAAAAGLAFIDEGAGMLLLEPAVLTTDILIGLRAACAVPLAPFSVSGEYARFAPPDGRDWRLLTEVFTMLKRAGADQIITYAAADLARSLG